MQRQPTITKRETAEIFTDFSRKKTQRNACGIPNNFISAIT